MVFFIVNLLACEAILFTTDTASHCSDQHLHLNTIIFTAWLRNAIEGIIFFSALLLQSPSSSILPQLPDIFPLKYCR